MNERDICRMAIGPQDTVGAPCGNCGHCNLAHPGVANPALTECPVCRLLFVIEQVGSTVASGMVRAGLLGDTP